MAAAAARLDFVPGHPSVANRGERPAITVHADADDAKKITPDALDGDSGNPWWGTCKEVRHSRSPIAVNVEPASAGA
jgi:hypothetical protein